MAVEILNWVEIPVADMQRARRFYESVFECTLTDMELDGTVYPCFPNRNGEGYSGALVQYDFLQPGNKGPLVYFTSYGRMDAMIDRIRAAGGTVIEGKKEIAPGFGYFALFEDSEGNLLALQDQ